MKFVIYHVKHMNPVKAARCHLYFDTSSTS